MGSLLFTDVSQLLGGDDRVAAGIVPGIGFLGAGVIFREGYTVRGITTAATIWAAAAIGMAIGRELYLVAGARPAPPAGGGADPPSHPRAQRGDGIAHHFQRCERPRPGERRR